MGLLGIFAGLALLVWLAYRGWSVLGLAPPFLQPGWRPDAGSVTSGATQRDTGRFR